jgi:hypothetical protein
VIALFDHGGARYALIPGGSAPLGFDPRRELSFTEDCLESWRTTVRDLELEMTLDEYLSRVMSPSREVRIEPLLVEVDAWEAGAVTAESGTRTVNWRSLQQISQELADEGFRLPTSDEWEYACRGGSASLFRWGDRCPADHYPGEDGGWDVHTKPNAFGLRFPKDTFKWEFTSEPGVLRGGDGGGLDCGGAGCFVAWLTLASAYVDPSARHWEGKAVPGAHVRRVVTIPVPP